MSQSKVSKIETGRLLPSVADVESLADALRAAPAVKADLIDMTTALQTESHTWRALHGPGFQRHQEAIRRAEREATTIRLFQPNIIPGLLQTAEYCRHVLTVAGYSIDNMAAAVASRLARQTALYDQGKSFRFVITEGALRWRLSPVPVHLAAIDRVANLSTLANVSVGVIPLDTLTPAMPTNQFKVCDDTFAVVETLHSELTLKEGGQVRLYLDQFERLDALAHHEDEARTILSGIASDLRRMDS